MTNVYDGILRDLPKDMRWSYRAEATGGGTRIYHYWTLAGDNGGIHVSAWRDSLDPYRWMGGIEMHSPVQLYGDDPKAPDHEHCWVIGKPCYHDGSSLQFSEQIAPEMPERGESMDDMIHGYVLLIMLDRYRSWLPASGIEAATADETRSGSAEGESPAPEQSEGETPNV